MTLARERLGKVATTTRRGYLLFQPFELECSRTLGNSANFYPTAAAAFKSSASFRVWSSLPRNSWVLLPEFLAGHANDVAQPGDFRCPDRPLYWESTALDKNGRATRAWRKG